MVDAAPRPALDRSALAAFCEERATRLDGAQTGNDSLVRETLGHLRDAGLLALGLPARDGRTTPLRPMAEVLRAVGEQCMSSAFALWCHRMVLEYVARAQAGNAAFGELLERLLAVELVGSTALGTAMANLLGAGPLPVTFRRADGEIVLDGRIPWASNLFPPHFVMIAGAVDAHGDRILVAVPGDVPGLTIDPYPDLLALQSTGSSSAKLDGVRVPERLVLTDDFAGFLRGVRPTFLLLQSSFCWGLAGAAAAAARAAIRGVNESLDGELASVEARLAELSRRIERLLETPDAAIVPMREFVQLRLDFALLARDATQIDAAIQGGRGYVARCATARRLREAAFLPVQAPTEGQLRWELSRSA